MLNWTEYVRARLKLPLLPGPREAEIVEQIAQYLQEAYEDALADGCSESEARDRTFHQISDWAKFSQEISARERGSISTLQRWAIYVSAQNSSSPLAALIEGLARDLVLAVRTLRRNPGFTFLATGAIALGVAATLTSFSLFYAAFLNPLPYPRSQDLVTISGFNRRENVTAGAVSAADFYDWKTQNESFTSMTAYSKWAFNVTGTYEPQRIDGALVTPDFFNTLQVHPVQGRAFRPDEEEPGKSDVVVVSTGLWTRLFGSGELRDQQLTLNGTRMRVVGVMPADFDFPDKQIQLWVPLALSPADRQNRSGRWLSVIARLKQGYTHEKAENNMTVISSALERTYPQSNSGWETRVASLRETLSGYLRKPLVLLQAAVSFLFLAGCLNVAGLVLARTKAREGEIVTRLVLGATRLRMVRQFACESLLFSTAGAVVGILFAGFIVRFMRTELTRIVPALDRVAMNGVEIAMGISLAGISMLVCGLLPAMHAARDHVRIASNRAPTRALRIRQALVIAQVALTVVLAVGAMVNIRSFLNLSAVDPGFNPQNVLSLDLVFPKTKYTTTKQQILFLRQLEDRVRHLPGVAGTGVVSDPPLRQNSMTFHVMREQDRDLDSNRLPQAGVRWFTAGYFSAMQIPVLKGRAITPQDTDTAPLAALVNRAMWKRMWPDRNPIGEKIRLEEDPRWFSVVGVVDDVKQLALSRDEVPALYLPYEQKSEEWLRWGTLVVRSATPADQLVRAIRSQLRDIDPDQPISKAATIQQYIEDEVMLPRFASLASSGFSWLSLVLALTGVSAVVGFVVSQRTHEIGIRVALGAQRADVFRLVIREATWSAGIGLGIGLVSSIAVIRVMQTVLYGITSLEPLILASVGCVMALLILLASYIPAAKALLIDPIRALRYE